MYASLPIEKPTLRGVTIVALSLMVVLLIAERGDASCGDYLMRLDSYEGAHGTLDVAVPTKVGERQERPCNGPSCGQSSPVHLPAGASMRAPERNVGNHSALSEASRWYPVIVFCRWLRVTDDIVDFGVHDPLLRPPRWS